MTFCDQPTKTGSPRDCKENPVVPSIGFEPTTPALGEHRSGAIARGQRPEALVSLPASVVNSGNAPVNEVHNVDVPYALPRSLVAEDGVPTPEGVRFGRSIIMRRCAHRIRLDDETVVDCKTRDFYSCPHCAALYRGDWQAIIRDGLYSLTEPARIVFMTLTAPSFGAVHRIPSKSDKAKRSRCSCGETHTSADSALRGVAVDPERYDYLGQVAWNRDCGALWRLTLTYLRRALPFEFDYVKVYEWQARGALHLHLILRLPPSATSDVIETIRRTCLSTTSPSKIDGEYRGWGERIDVADCGLYMPEDRGRMATSMDGVVRYVGKVLGYVGKSLLEQASRVGSTYPQALEHFRRLSYAAFVTPCSRDCPVTGCSSPRHRNIGASSHVVSASRKSGHREGWSPSGLNRTILGRRRSEYIEARKEERSAAGEKEVELPRSVNLTRYEMKALFLHQAGIAHGVVPERSSAQNA